MTTYDRYKICYKYNRETYKYERTGQAVLDVSLLEKRNIARYIFPDDGCYTFEEPPVVDEFGEPVLEENESIIFNPNISSWNIQKEYEEKRPLLVKPNEVVYSDINTRIIDYSRDAFLTDDARAVFQSIYRLITTDEGEIPYFRTYGCNLKRFLQRPLTKDTANLIHDYIKDRVSKFETRGGIVSSDAAADMNNNTIRMNFYVQCYATGETGVLPDLYVKVNRSRG